MPSLPRSQQRVLDHIERTLLEDDRRLASLFVTFTQLTGHEAMPWAERVTARPWLLRPRVRAKAALVIGLAAVMSALLIALLTPGPRPCPAWAASAPAQHFRAGSRAACPAPPPAGITHAVVRPPGS